MNGPRPPRISPAWRNALHEAGHAVLSHAVGWRPVELRASRSRGWCIVASGPRTARVWNLAQAMAGPVAEKRADYAARWCNAGPLRPILKPRVERRPRRHPDGQPRHAPNTPSKHDADIAREQAQAGHRPSDPGGERYLRRLAGATACRVLQARETTLHRLADLLYRHGHLSGDEIADVLSDETGLERATRLMLAALKLHARRLKPHTQTP